MADKHPDVVAKMREAYDAWWTKTVPLMVNEDAPYAKEHPQDVRYEAQLKTRGIPDWSAAESVIQLVKSAHMLSPMPV